MKKMFSTRELAYLGALAAVSAALQLFHLGYQSAQWGMWIDFVAVTWIMAFFLFGVKASFTVSLLGAVIITLFAPDTWLGASMKWMATMPVFLSLYLFLVIQKENPGYFRNWKNIIVPVILGIIVRSLIVIPVNYFYAIPIWTGMTPGQAMGAIPWYIIAGFNSVQTLIEVIIAHLLVFKSGFQKYAAWNE